LLQFAGHRWRQLAVVGVAEPNAHLDGTDAAGLLAGGGVSLVRASQKLKLKTRGAQIVKQAILEPVRQMARNAGDSPDVVVEKICKSKGSKGWNFAKGKMMNMFEEGVVDPFKVTRCALQNASSAASTLITTNYAIISKGGGR
jgi:chaperonin GroEL